MPNKFIDIEKVLAEKNPTLKKWLPKFAVNIFKKLIHQDFINNLIANNKDKFDADFCDSVIEHMNIKVIVKGLDNIPKSGGCYLVGNHPLGGMDAMALVHGFKSVRPDLKFIVNDILLKIKNLSNMFYGINKHGKTAADSLKRINGLFASDNAVFIFPSGLVSRRLKGLVRDLEWKKTFVTRAKKNNKLVVPVYLDGEMSSFFYRLSNFRKSVGIKANIEMLFLVDEMKKQEGKTIHVYVGEPIDPKSLDKSKTDKEWAEWIKEKVYSLDKN